MQIKNFEDLEIWQLARIPAREIYILGRAQKLSKDYGLKDQMQRAAVSIMSNIAEGFERAGNQEFVQFLYIAKASCGELRSQLLATLRCARSRIYRSSNSGQFAHRLETISSHDEAPH